MQFGGKICFVRSPPPEGHKSDSSDVFLQENNVSNISEQYKSSKTNPHKWKNLSKILDRTAIIVYIAIEILMYVVFIPK